MDKLYKMLVTFFYLGLSPYMPGTMGTLGAAIVYVGLWYMGWARLGILLFFFGVTCLLTIWLGSWAERKYSTKDPRWVVLDEVAGFFLTIILLQPSWAVVAGGFLLFRIFDITKPYPIRKLEALPGGTGILCDDLLAGVYAALILILASFLAHLVPMELAISPALWHW